MFYCGSNNFICVLKKHTIQKKLFKLFFLSNLTNIVHSKTFRFFFHETFPFKLRLQSSKSKTSLFLSDILRIVLDRGKNMLFIFSIFLTPFGTHAIVPFNLRVQKIWICKRRIFYHDPKLFLYVIKTTWTVPGKVL